jgi:hypothetical protein
MSRLEIEEEEAGRLADSLFALHHTIMNGAETETILAQAEKFVNEFDTEIRFVERKHTPRSRKNSYAEKRKTQLDFFSVPSDQTK